MGVHLLSLAGTIKDSLQNCVHQLSASKNYTEFKSGCCFCFGVCPLGHLQVTSHNAWSHEETSQHLTICGPAGSWARMVYVQARARFLQADALSSIIELVVGTSSYFKQGCLAETFFNLRTTHKHLVRGPRTSWWMQRW